MLLSGVLLNSAFYPFTFSLPFFVMEQLNQYLQTLLSSAGYELHLEPNKNPYVISANGQADVAPAPLLGTQISMMVFPLIPPEVKQDLPNLPTIQFVHPHNLGRFSFTVEKSPAGFNVTVRPLLGNELDSQTPTIPDLISQPVSPENHIDDANIFNVESSSAVKENVTSLPVDVPAVSELLVEDRESMPKIEIEAGPAVEVISANDPQFQTVFSDSSNYEPPGRRQDFEGIQPEASSAQFEVLLEQETLVPVPPVPEHTTVPSDVVLTSFERRNTDRRKRNFIMTARQ
jgi:hypothetical protein